MKIEIKNFGPIREFVFDLDKDLHLIYGENSIGKSYAVYVVYGLIKVLREKLQWSQTHSEYFDVEIRRIVTRIAKERKKNIDITNSIRHVFAAYFKHIFSPHIEKILHNTFLNFAKLNNSFAKENFEIILDFDNGKYINFFYGELRLQCASHFVDEKHAIVSLDEDVYSYQIGDKNLLSEGVRLDDLHFTLKEIMHRNFNNIFKKTNDKIDDIYFLPASRSGLYQSLSSLTPLLAELSQNRFYLKNNKIELPSLSEPVSDYFIDLSSINKGHINDEFEELIEKMQSNLLKGRVFFDDNDKKIRYQPENSDLEFDLSESSSMVSELAPIVLFLRHIIKNRRSERRGLRKDIVNESEQNNYNNHIKQNILIIEEPEAHLHPKLQLKLMQFFAELTKLNIKVVITSHSNYMFNKLSNMLLAGEVKPEKTEIYHMVMTDKGSIVKDDMRATEDGAEDHNFAEVAEELYAERIRLYNQQNAATDAD